jgi:hypothetical protein
MASARGGRPRIRDREELKQHVEFGYPPQLEALLELIGRTMLEVGEMVSNANRWSGHEEKGWVDDAYAWNQAVDAAQLILKLSRHNHGEPHGLFASADYPKHLAEQLGRQAAAGILEIMSEWHESESGGTTSAHQWAPQLRARLGSIADRLDRHPSPEEYSVRTREPAPWHEGAEHRGAALPEGEIRE